MAYSSILKPTDYFNTKLYTGNGTSQSITGLDFAPDFVWIKDRDSGVAYHRLVDTIRGATKLLYSNGANAEDTDATSLTSFNSDGFTVSSGGGVNASGNSFVSWDWLAGGTASSNTDGSITSSVSANTTSGFSIVSYTGTGSAATVGHGLSQAPAIVIVKRRSSTGEWIVYSSVLGSGNGLKLNTTGASFTADATVWNSTNPTSSVFSIGSAVDLNASGNTYIAYCFAEKQGFSKFGSYVGNGSTDGTFIYTGFKTAFVLLKVTTAADSWVMYDNKRDTFNVTEQILRPNTSGAEGTEPGAKMDLLSNGFKLRGSGGGIGQTNTSGQTYIYMAFAEEPFVASNFNAATAR